MRLIIILYAYFINVNCSDMMLSDTSFKVMEQLQQLDNTLDLNMDSSLQSQQENYYRNIGSQLPSSQMDFDELNYLNAEEFKAIKDLDKNNQDQHDLEKKYQENKQANKKDDNSDASDGGMFLQDVKDNNNEQQFLQDEKQNNNDKKQQETGKKSSLFDFLFVPKSNKQVQQKEDKSSIFELLKKKQQSQNQQQNMQKAFNSPSQQQIPKFLQVQNKNFYDKVDNQINQENMSKQVDESSFYKQNNQINQRNNIQIPAPDPVKRNGNSQSNFVQKQVNDQKNQEKPINIKGYDKNQDKMQIKMQNFIGSKRIDSALNQFSDIQTSYDEKQYNSIVKQIEGVQTHNNTSIQMKQINDDQGPSIEESKIFDKKLQDLKSRIQDPLIPENTQRFKNINSKNIKKTPSFAQNQNNFKKGYQQYNDQRQQGSQYDVQQQNYPPLQQDLPPIPLQQDLPPPPLQQDLPPIPLQKDLPPPPLQQDLPPPPLQQDLPPIPLQKDLPPIPLQKPKKQKPKSSDDMVDEMFSNRKQQIEKSEKEQSFEVPSINSFFSADPKKHKQLEDKIEKESLQNQPPDPTQQLDKLDLKSAIGGSLAGLLGGSSPKKPEKPEKSELFADMPKPENGEQDIKSKKDELSQLTAQLAQLQKMDSETDKDIKKQQKDIGKVPHFGEVD